MFASNFSGYWSSYIVWTDSSLLEGQLPRQEQSVYWERYSFLSFE